MQYNEAMLEVKMLESFLGLNKTKTYIRMTPTIVADWIVMNGPHVN